MLKQIALVYLVSWSAALAVAAVLEWRQLTGRGGTGTLKALVIGWVALPFVAPTLVGAALARRRAGRRPA